MSKGSTGSITSLDAMEQILLEKGSSQDTSPAPVFLIASPRTGSTYAYQLLVGTFGLPFISNFTNEHFPHHPILGLSIQRSWCQNQLIDTSSAFGKTVGLFQPSEASAVMTNWFGGGHPSEITSRHVIHGKEEHMIQTLAAAEVLFSRPLLIKNAWNCFRLDYLHQTFPNSKFIWLRRDIAAAAKSDLQARYITKKLPTAWNSATPRNYPHLKTRPYWEQVVENQYEFARAIQDHISMAGKQHITEVWYEDLLEDEEQTLSQLASAAPELGACLTESQLRRHEPTKSISTSLSPEDDKAIEQYIAATSTRLTNCRYPTK